MEILVTTASPTKLLAARYAIAATAIASTTALTVGLAAPAVAATNVAHPTGEQLTLLTLRVL